MDLPFNDVIRRESELLALAAEKVPLDTPVPSCPGWDMGALVGHIGTTQTWTAQMVETRAQQRLDRKTLPPPPSGAAVIPWFRGVTTRLLTALRNVDPATPMWTLAPQHTAGCWSRRQAHEVTVHRWDAQNTVGVTNQVDGTLAVDGVDELLEMRLALRPEIFVGEPGTVHLHATDVPGEWFLQLGAHGLTVEHRHAKGDVAARGPASQLYLHAWGRITDATLEVFGNRALLARLQTLTAI